MQLRALYEKFAKHPNGMWTIEWGFAVQLERTLKKYDIKRVLDLGTGIGGTTAIVADTLEEKGVKDYHIDTVEQLAPVIEIAKSVIPEELQKNITFHQSDPVIWYTDKVKYQPFSTYQELPEGDYDLIIHDGPGPWLEGEDYVDFPNGTLIKMLQEDRVRPGTLIAWDKRATALKLLERYYGGNFYMTNFDKRAGFILLKRKDTPLIYEDIVKIAEAKWGYFDTPEEQSAKIKALGNESRHSGRGADR